MKQKIAAAVIALIIIIGLGTWLVIDISENRRLDATSVVFRADRAEVEFASELQISDFLASLDGELIDNDVVDTTTLGEHEVKFHYYNSRHRKRTATLFYTVVDTTPPLIYGQNSYTVNVGYDGELIDLMLSGDAVDDQPERKIDGKYNLNRAGNYTLQYIVTDASGNTAHHNFTLYVVEPSSSTSSNSEQTATDDTRTPVSEVINAYKNGNTAVGIDISSWQDKINWQKVKSSGVEFAMIRLGYQIEYGGEYILDQNFTTNIEGALEVGLPVGVYFYSCANSVSEAMSQATWVLDQVREYPLELGIAFDWENWSVFNQASVSFYTLGQIANTFLDTVEDAGYRGLLYGSKNYLDVFWQYNTHDVWLAQYYDRPTYSQPFRLWQLTSSGKVNGISTAVDIDILYK